MRVMSAVVASVALLSGATPISAQLASEGRAVVDDRASTFRAGVDLVTLNVVVTDPGQRPIAQVPAESFQVYEDNVPQQVTYFVTDDLPVDLAVVIDTSQSMVDNMPALRAAAVKFLEVMRPGDRITVVGVNGRATVLHPLDDDDAGAVAAIRRAKAGGTTALYDAVYLTLHELQRQLVPGEPRRQVMTVFSDGEDTTSMIDFHAVQDYVRRSGVTVYPMLLKSHGPTVARLPMKEDPSFAMKDLARESGGRPFFPEGMSQVPDVYRVIADEIRAQYTLGYISTNAVRDGRYRRVVVRMNGVAGAARTRSGYYAQSASAPR